MTRLRALISLWPRFYLPLLLAFCFATAWMPLGGGDDFWAHAAIGRWIAQNGRVPQETLFLWGDRQPWVAHSWASQLWFYTILNAFGERGGALAALLFAGAMGALTIAVIWRAWGRLGRVTSLTPILFALAIWCGATRAKPRPELFTGLFFAILLAFLLEQTRRENEKISWRAYVGIPAMFALWANFHGAVAAGLLLLFLTTFFESVQRSVEDKRLKISPLALLLCACALAICLNPYGLGLWTALRPVGGAMFAQIDEWKPFWKWPALDMAFPAVGGVLTLFALLSWLGNSARRWSHGVWLLVWALFFLSARRHLWMLSLVSLAVMAANSSAIDSGAFWAALMGPNRNRTVPEIARAWVRPAVVLFIFVVVLRQTPRSVIESFPPRATARYWPVQAATMLKSVARNRRVFNDYEYSSYLQWRCAGKPPLYIDLLNAYRDTLLSKDYFDIAKATPRGKKMLNQLKINCVFLRRHNPKKDSIHKLMLYLESKPEWKRVYNQPDATIWVRDLS
jgi:hypothetical protein